MNKIKRLICVNVPVTTCNLRCKYCYITQTNQWSAKFPEFEYTAEHIGRCLSVGRLGGTCLINLTGGGETLLPPVMTSIIRNLLEQGHYLEVVTNGTITKRFDEIAELPKELLKRLVFKFSFHYLELKRLDKLDTFFNNVNKMREAGCSFTVECTPNDELISHIEEMKVICIEKVGALCQLTIARTDTEKDKRILTSLPQSDYIRTWKIFTSTMFDFKMTLFYVKRNEFCYAGDWSLYINLCNGDTKQCYGQLVTQNIFRDINKPIKFSAVGKYCRQPHCYNGHAFLTLGVIPELKTPSYADIRNRVCCNGSEWFTLDCKEFFSSKLVESNEEYTVCQKVLTTIFKPIVQFPYLIKSMPLILKKIYTRLK